MSVEYTVGPNLFGSTSCYPGGGAPFFNPTRRPPEPPRLVPLSRAGSSKSPGSGRPGLPRLIRGIQFNIEEPYPYYSRMISEEDVVELAERASANLLIVFARDAWGRSFYPSRLYPRHPSGFSAPRLVELAAEKGITVVLMTSHTANKWVAEARPELVQRGPDGSPRALDHTPEGLREEPLWPMLCPVSPALEEFLAPEAGEALDAAPGAAGILLDSFRYMPDPGRACFCRWCREGFRRETGMELPAGRCPGCEREYREAWRWRIRRHVEAVERIASEAKRRGGVVAYNTHPGGWSGRGSVLGYHLRGVVDALFAELSEADAAGPLFERFMVKLTLAVGGGARVMATRNMFHDLVTLRSAPPALIARGLWGIAAAGGEPVATLFASTLREDPRFLEALSTVYRAMERLEGLLVDRSPVYEAVILYSPLSMDWHVHEAPWAYMGELMGLARGLSELGLPWGLMVAEDLASGEPVPGDARVVAAADLGVAGGRLLDALAGMAVDGRHALLSTGLTGVRDESLAPRDWSPILDLLGLDYLGAARPGAAFLEPADVDGGRRIPIGLYDHWFRGRRWDPWLGEVLQARPRSGVEGVKVLYTLTLPAAGRGHEYTAGRSHPPPGPRTGLAAVAHAPGVALHAYRLGLHIHVTGHPDYTRLLAASMEHLDPEPRLRVLGPQLEAWRQGERLILHLEPPEGWGRLSPGEATPSAAGAPAILPPRSLAIPRMDALYEALVEARLWEPGEKLSLEVYDWRGEPVDERSLEAPPEGALRVRLSLRGPHSIAVLEPRR